MSDHWVLEAAAEGFKGSLLLARDLLTSLVRAPFVVVRAFVRDDRSARYADPARRP
jgi:hypothetical protein